VRVVVAGVGSVGVAAFERVALVVIAGFGKREVILCTRLGLEGGRMSITSRRDALQVTFRLPPLVTVPVRDRTLNTSWPPPLGSPSMVSSPKFSPARRRSIAVLNMSDSKSKSGRRRPYSIAPGDKLSPLSRSRRSLVRNLCSLSKTILTQHIRNPGSPSSNEPLSRQMMLHNPWISRQSNVAYRLPRNPRFVYTIKTTEAQMDQLRVLPSKIQNKEPANRHLLSTTRMRILGPINPDLDVEALCGAPLELISAPERSLWNLIRRKSWL
jgi:hypothetical protein